MMSATIKKTIRVLLFLLVFSFAFSYVMELHARPGGGSSFSSGSSSSGSSGSGGGGGGIPIQAIPYLLLVGLGTSFTSAGFNTLRGKVLKNKKVELNAQFILLGGAAYYAQAAVNADEHDLSFGNRFLKSIPLLFLGFPLGVVMISVLGLTQSAAIVYDILAGGALLLFYMKNKDNEELSEVVSSGADMGVSPKGAMQVENRLETLKKQDEAFSKVLFLDFATSLYHKYYTYFGKANLKDIKPFLSEEAEGELAHEAEKHSASHQEIVIGSMRIVDVLLLNDIEGIAVDIDANYTKTIGGRSTRYIVQERWLFNRKKGVKSATPEKLYNLSCPNCGAPTNFTDNGTCNYCEATINLGEMQWFLKKKAVLRLETFKVQGLGVYAPERGTALPTVYQTTLEKWKAQFGLNHQLNFDEYWQSFQMNVVSKFFMAIYGAWSENKWEKVRHLLSDRLYESNEFWLDEYQKQGLTNKLENINIQKVSLARIDLDRYYESFTVRIHAACLDYVEDKNGKLIGGSKSKPRKFSEYWTFIRRTGVEKPESEYDLTSCPSCGAGTDKMGQAAECGYCGAKVSTGEYYWVLTMITQDEVYKG